MRLIRCHIENFGKLQDYSVDFDRQRNIFCQENGWGKSTLAAFIRVMFFGFEGETKRKGLENERKRYQPWQGGIYGGQVVFEANGRLYHMTRIFKDKKQNDIFQLRDGETNLESNDFSDQVGEELFHINSESFLRTVFIGQNDCVTHSTDSINAKIGNLSDNLNDLECYEKAAGILKDELNRLTPRRKTGEIYQRNEEITRMGTEVLAGETLADSMDQYEALVKQERTLLTEKENQRQELVRMQKTVSLVQDRKAKQAAYGQLCEEYGEKEAAYKSARAKFPGELLDEEEFQACLGACDEMEQAAHRMEIYHLSQEESDLLDRYEKGKPSRAGNGVNNATEIDILINDSGGNMDVPLTEKMEQVSNLVEKVREAEQRKSILQMKAATLNTLKATLRSEKQPEKKGVSPVLILGIVLMVLGAALLKLLVPAGVAGIVYGAVLLGIGVIAKKRKVVPQEDTETASVKESIDRLEAEVKQDEIFVKSTYEQVAAFFRETGEDFSEAAALMRLQEVFRELSEKERKIKEKKQLLVQIQEKQKNYHLWKQKYELEKQFVLAQLQKLGLVPGENLKEQMHDVWRNHILLDQTQKELSVVAGKKRDFELKQDVDRFTLDSHGEQLPTLESLSQQMSTLDREMTQHQKQIRLYEDQLEQLQEKYDTWMDTKEQMEIRKDELKQLRWEYKCMQKAQDYLARAKESLTARYMEPLMNRFAHYYQLIIGQKPEHYHMDANTNLSVEEQGMQRETAYLSSGYQDLIGLSMRLALVDAMYQEEKPFLILDDPFVNLDDEKLCGARKLLENVEKHYQVIYFTCSGIRGT